MRGLLSLTFVSLLLAAPMTSARDIEGVAIPESATVADTPLVLNGAGIRSRFFVKVYIGALYLPAKQTGADAVIASGGAKRVYMHFLYKELEASKLTDAWTDGFKSNHGEPEFQALKPRLDQFNGMFRSVRRGETISLDLLPNGDTRLTINNDTRGTITGADFQQALLRVWLGEKPADGDLKRGMLGG